MPWPRCRASVKVTLVMDRTITINASVHDVEITLLLTFCLVILVIFLFLRNAWATIIPGVTVPLSLLGTCARHVPAGLQPRQPLADGPDHCGRIRGR